MKLETKVGGRAMTLQCLLVSAAIFFFLKLFNYFFGWTLLADLVDFAYIVLCVYLAFMF